MYQDVLRKFPEYSLCFVDDGSIDCTYNKLQEIQSSQPCRVFLLRNQRNVGKAESVRKGINFILKQAGFDLIGFMDADLSTPFSEIDYMSNFLQSSDTIEIVCGSRIKRMGARIVRKSFRHYTGRIIATAISILLNMPFYDTQCGAKIMKLGTGEICFGEPFSSTWLFDVELFMRMRAHFGQDVNYLIYEHPLKEWVHKEKSKVEISYLFKIPIDLLKIRLRYGQT